MKKLFVAMVAISMVAFVSCGGAKKEEVKADSTAVVSDTIVKVDTCKKDTVKDCEKKEEKKVEKKK